MLKVSVHAVERYEERVSGEKRFTHMTSIRGRLIQRVLRRAEDAYYKNGMMKGYYKIEENTYVLIEDETIITTIVKENRRDTFITKGMFDEYVEEARNDASQKQQRVKRRIKEIHSKHSVGFVKAKFDSPEARRIDELLNQIKKAS